MLVDQIKKVADGVPVFAISSTAHKGLTDVLRALRVEVLKSRQVAELVNEENESDMPTISLSDAKIAESWDVERVEDERGVRYIVSGEKIEKFARRTNFDNYEGLNRLRDIMKKLGISHELRRRGAEGTSMIHIGEDSFPFVEQ